MKFLNSVLKTLKEFWYFFVILFLTIVIVAVGFIENSKLSGLTSSLKSLVDGYKKQVKTVDKLADKRSEDDKKTREKYDNNTKKIEEKKQEELKKVEETKKETVETLKKKSADELAKKMKEEFKL